MEKHTPAEVRKQPDYSGVMDITAQRRIIGKINLDGLTEARERMRILCADAIGKGAPAGNYLTTGLDGFDPEVIVGGLPGTASVAPKPKATAPSLGEAECRALLQRTGTAMVPKIQQLAAVLSNVSSQSQFCQGARMTIAFHGEVKKRIAACSSHGFVRQTISSSNSAIANTRAQMRKAGC